MCLAIPAKVLKTNKDEAEVESFGVVKKINISLVPDVRTGDFVIIHAGFAIQLIDKDEAEITQGYWKKYFSEDSGENNLSQEYKDEKTR